MLLRLQHFLLVLILLGVSCSLTAQSELLVAVKNESVSFTFLSEFEPSIGQQPDHGSIELVQDPIYNYTLTYTPDEDFIGLDAFLLVSHPFGFNVRFQEYVVEVKEADVRAHHDQAATIAGQSVMIPVLDNDFVNIGELTLSSAPVCNAGTAEVVGDQIRFTPSPGFVGLTDLNYVVCTTGEVCDLGTVTVSVSPAGTSTIRDTVRVFTKKNQAQFIFANEQATPQSTPGHGQIIDSAGLMAYQPDTDFVGVEQLVYRDAASGATTIFEVTVLDLEDNAFASEDRVYTPTGVPITFNVLDNDLYTAFTSCVVFGTPRYGSLLETGVNGEIQYAPPTGWSGVDRFTYASKAPGCNGEPELETVYVFVSDFAPAPGTNELQIPAGTTLPITYEVPNGTAVWSAASYPDFGALTRDAETGGLNYAAPLTAAGNTDRFSVTYCLNPDENGTCASSFTIPVTITIEAPNNDFCDADGCVWPGDTNNDGVVDVSDLLPIGSAMGRSGTPRLSRNNADWNAQTAEDWGATHSGMDLKYIDANGDQVISALDTMVVVANLGKAHRLRAEAQTFTTFELSLIGPETASPGDLIQLDIIAGSETVIVEDVYGFRFPFIYDPVGVQPARTNVQFDESSWISYDSPIISVSKNDTVKGVVHTAVSRTNNSPISGFGSIGKLNTVIVEDVYGFFGAPDSGGDAEADETILSIGGGVGSATTVGGFDNSVKVNPAKIRLVSTTTDLSKTSPGAANEFLDRHLLTFPNPVSDLLTVHLNAGQSFTAYQLTDMTGRVILRKAGLDTNHRVINLTDIPGGMYTLTLTAEAGVVNRMIQVR